MGRWADNQWRFPQFRRWQRLGDCAVELSVQWCRDLLESVDRLLGPRRLLWRWSWRSWRFTLPYLQPCCFGFRCSRPRTPKMFRTTAFSFTFTTTFSFTFSTAFSFTFTTAFS